MKEIKILRDVEAKGVSELGAWIRPSFSRGTENDNYTVTVENGYIFQADVKIMSEILSEVQLFQLSTPQKNWEAKMYGVADKEDKDSCAVLPISGQNRIKIRIQNIKLKYRGDCNWREKDVGYVAEF